ncbi:MAG: histidine triad nucleotide-binding protein [Phototrophicaceae bacterium]|jgi:histidine triad (HIT) family protein
MPSIFTKIINGEIPGDFVYRDDLVVAFRDINPQAPVHVLIVPIKEIPNLKNVTAEDEAILGRMLHVARLVAEKEGIADGGYRTIINNGEDAGQEVYHIHVHVLGGRRLGPMIVKRD